MTYNFNLLVSHEWGNSFPARQEILSLLREFGDEHPFIGRTIAKGLLGVKTELNNRSVIKSLIAKFTIAPSSFQFTLKWVPIDRWCESTIDAMKETLSTLQTEIHPGERWMMQVEKRRYTAHHKVEVIKELASLIDEKVDLEKPDKVVWVEIVGNQAGIAVVTPEDIFSLNQMRARSISIIKSDYTYASS